MWNLAAPPGFQGLREDQDLLIYVRKLPHWRQEGATYFVTFRLGDSLPQARRRELAARRAQWERGHPAPRCPEAWRDFSRRLMARDEGWLDEGFGTCDLKDPHASAAVAETMRRFDTVRYELGALVVMPNHVHALVRPLAGKDDPLEAILHTWKRFSAREINRRRGQVGPLWQRETFDRIVRDEEHLYRCIQYLGSNPGKAGFSSQSCRRWIRPEWKALGWGFVDR